MLVARHAGRRQTDIEGHGGGARCRGERKSESKKHDGATATGPKIFAMTRANFTILGKKQMMCTGNKNQDVVRPAFRCCPAGWQQVPNQSVKELGSSTLFFHCEI